MDVDDSHFEAFWADPRQSSPEHQASSPNSDAAAARQDEWHLADELPPQPISSSEGTIEPAAVPEIAAFHGLLPTLALISPQDKEQWASDVNLHDQWGRCVAWQEASSPNSDAAAARDDERHVAGELPHQPIFSSEGTLEPAAVPQVDAFHGPLPTLSPLLPQDEEQWGYDFELHDELGTYADWEEASRTRASSLKLPDLNSHDSPNPFLDAPVPMADEGRSDGILETTPASYPLRASPPTTPPSFARVKYLCEKQDNTRTHAEIFEIGTFLLKFWRTYGEYLKSDLAKVLPYSTALLYKNLTGIYWGQHDRVTPVPLGHLRSLGRKDVPRDVREALLKKYADGGKCAPKIKMFEAEIDQCVKEYWLNQRR